MLNDPAEKSGTRGEVGHPRAARGELVLEFFESLDFGEVGHPRADLLEWGGVCGIVAVLRRPAGRSSPSADEVLAAVPDARSSPDTLAVSDQVATVDWLATIGRLSSPSPAPGLAWAAAGTAAGLARADALLGGVPGLKLMLSDRSLAGALAHRLDVLEETVLKTEARLDAGGLAAGTAELEQLNHDLVGIRDGIWALRRDRLGSARSVSDLIGAASSEAALAAGLSVHQALAALDRLEVRGRDSAGLHLLVRGHGLDLGDPTVASALEARSRDRDFGSGSVRLADGMLSFVYKTAAEIGNLGDNTAALRAAIRDDELLAAALAGAEARALVLAHTRWASVGIISEPNAHPLNSELIDPPDHIGGAAPPDAPYVVGAINGDIDNYADLMAAEEMAVPSAITTDSKAMPALMGRRLAAGLPAVEAFRRTVASFEGSVAVAACTTAAPGRLQLALRGSGQALYVGLAEDAYVVASEPYGLVEATGRYIRMDGETSGNPDNPSAGRGQVVELDEDSAGELEGVSRWSYDSAELPVTDSDVVRASITTRDIDRGDHPHYLLKELTQAPDSFRKTLRGKIVDTDAGPRVSLGPEIFPGRVRQGLRSGSVNRVLAVGQGTAAVACESLAAALGALAGRGLTTLALPATELSGFGLRQDMSDTLVIAISQSGTTTDTNRTVDLVRDRGAAVVAIVNRRDSDLTDRADGVLYTSDGRDVEMSVASTKSFYSQIAAGLLLAVTIAEEVAGQAEAEEVAGDDDGAEERARLLDAVRALPAALEEVLKTRAAIGAAARRFAPPRRHWAVVGSGSNRIAAREIRIKLSELCYKSISSDAIEDKKHIDLSSEPLVMVCAAGLTGSTAADAAKEVAIFRAHKAAPIVVADIGEERFDAAVAVLGVPATDPQLSFVPAAMVGHLFGYEAALAIDAQARPLREAHRALERAAARSDATSEEVMTAIAPAVERAAAAFSDGLRRGDYDGHLEASTAVRISTALRYALGRTPLDGYQLERGKVGTPTAVIEDLAASLAQGIAELSRPIDAIRHQAKTVTVGISRSDQALLQARLARAVIDAGASRDQLAWSVLRTLAHLDPAVAAVIGHTRYRVESLEAGDDMARLVVVDRGGISVSIASRADRTPDLIGTKHLVAVERQVLVATGRRDGRNVVLVPEVKNGVTTGITLLHVAFAERLSVDAARGVLQGYRNRYSELRDAVTETEPSFREDLLAAIAPVGLLTEPISELADRWRVRPDPG